MPRTYSFDHFTATKPAISVGKRAQTQRSVPLKSELQSHAGALHYGHAHSSTGELYKKHREEHDRLEAMRPPREEREAFAGESVETGAREEADFASDGELEFSREGLKDMAQSALGSVKQAAREALRGRPLVGARRLAGEAVTGALRVARQVSARTSRSLDNSSASDKGPSKKG